MKSLDASRDTGPHESPRTSPPATPEFEKGDGRLRPSLQQRLPGAEGPPEGCTTAPRHAACGGLLPSSAGGAMLFLLTAQDKRVAKGSARKAPAFDVSGGAPAPAGEAGY